jgi:hypothetical protein
MGKKFLSCNFEPDHLKAKTTEKESNHFDPVNMKTLMEINKVIC